MEQVRQQLQHTADNCDTTDNYDMQRPTMTLDRQLQQHMGQVHDNYDIQPTTPTTRDKYDATTTTYNRQLQCMTANSDTQPTTTVHNRQL